MSSEASLYSHNYFHLLVTFVVGGVVLTSVVATVVESEKTIL